MIYLYQDKGKENKDMMTKYYDLPNTVVAKITKALATLRPTTECHGTWMTVTVRGTEAEIEKFEEILLRTF